MCDVSCVKYGVGCAHFGGKLAVMHMCIRVCVYMCGCIRVCVMSVVECAHCDGRLCGNAYVYVCESVCMGGCVCACVMCDVCGWVCSFWWESCSNAYVCVCECICVCMVCDIGGECAHFGGRLCGNAYVYMCECICVWVYMCMCDV